MLTSGNLGIDLEGPEQSGMTPGAWYAASRKSRRLCQHPAAESHRPGDSAKLQDDGSNSLDSVEASALCYLVAFDLDRFDLGYALGTEHPKVGWSAHMLAKMRDPRLPGPDGIGSIAPAGCDGPDRPENAPQNRRHVHWRIQA